MTSRLHDNQGYIAELHVGDVTLTQQSLTHRGRERGWTCLPVETATETTVRHLSFHAIAADTDISLINTLFLPHCTDSC